MFPPPRRIPPLGPPKRSPRQRALAEWRGLDLSAQEKMRERPAQPVQHIMPKVLTNLRMDRRRAEAEIVRVWNNLIDPAISAHAQPTGLHKGTLFVTVDSNVLHYEIILYHRKEIIKRLQSSFGIDVIRKISFRVG